MRGHRTFFKDILKNGQKPRGTFETNVTPSLENQEQSFYRLIMKGVTVLAHGLGPLSPTYSVEWWFRPRKPY